MSVKDILGSGGMVPQLKPDEVEGTKIRRLTPKERFEQAMADGMETRGYMEGLGVDAGSMARVPGRGQMQPETDEKLLVTLIKGQMDVTNTLLKSMADNRRTGEDPLLKHVMEELAETRARLENAPDPMQALLSHNETIRKLTQDMKESLGITGSFGNGSTGDLKGMIELKRMEIDLSDRRSQWEADQKERQRQYDDDKLARQRRWDIEDRKWRLDYKLQLSKFQAEHTSREEVKSQLMDLGKSIIDSIDIERGAESRAGQAKTPAFKCEKCGQMVPVIEGARAASCQVCGAEYELVPMSEAARPAPQPVRQPVAASVGRPVNQGPVRPEPEEREGVAATGDEFGDIDEDDEEF
ncbi:MAG: hypothetical protein ABIH46_13025 [Chloroflexota bacterium]